MIEVARFGEYINLLSKLSRCCRAWHWHHQASSINWKSLCGLWDNSDSWGSKLHLLQFFLVIMEYYQIRLVTHLILLRLIPRIKAPRPLVGTRQHEIFIKPPTEIGLLHRLTSRHSFCANPVELRQSCL